MSTVVCMVEGCPFRRGSFCRKDFLSLTAGGQCGELFRPNGQPIPFEKVKEAANEYFRNAGSVSSPQEDN